MIWQLHSLSCLIDQLVMSPVSFKYVSYWKSVFEWNSTRFLNALTLSSWWILYRDLPYLTIQQCINANSWIDSKIGSQRTTVLPHTWQQFHTVTPPSSIQSTHAFIKAFTAVQVAAVLYANKGQCHEEHNEQHIRYSMVQSGLFCFQQQTYLQKRHLFYLKPRKTITKTWQPPPEFASRKTI